MCSICSYFKFQSLSFGVRYARMVVKLSSLRLSKRIPYWFSFKAHLFSLSCEMMNFPDHSQLDSSNFEAKIRFLKKGLHPDSLISSLDNTTDLNSSLKLFNWASLQRGFRHTAETYKMIISKLGMAGLVEEMEGLCNEMVRDKCHGFDKSLLDLIDLFVCNCRLNEALRVLYVMNLSSLKPSLGVFNALMGALVKGRRDFKDVVFVYMEMVKAGVLPNIDTLNYLIDALVESGRIDAAIYQYRRLEKKGCKPNITTFQIVISGLAANNRVQQSIDIVEEMFQCGCEPDYSFYTCMIPLFCGVQKLESGLKLFRMMKASNLTPDYAIYVAVTRCLCEHLHMDSAIDLLEEMIGANLFPDILVNLDIVKGFCKANKLVEARKFLEERNLMDAGLHNAILSAYCDNGNFTIAKDKFDEMFESGITDATSWNILIRFLCENSAIDKAMQYLSRMIVASFLPDSASYSALILGSSRVGNLTHALDLYRHVRSKLWLLDYFSYAELLECLCRRGSVEEAFEVFCYMSSKGCALRTSSFGMLIEKMCSIGDVKRAIKLSSLAYYADTVSLFATYNSLLRGLSLSLQEDHLHVILSRMIVSGCDFDVETYCSLIRFTSSLGRFEESAYVFNLMLSHHLIPDSEALAHLLSCLSKYSKVNFVLPSIRKLVSMSKTLDQKMHEVLIDSLWREGHKSEASHLLDVMLEKGWVPDTSMHSLLMGSATRNEMSIKLEDNVSSILEEGLWQQ